MTCHVRRLPVRQPSPCGSETHPPRFLPHPPGSQPRSAAVSPSGQTAGHIPPRSSTAVFRLVSPSWRAMAHPVTPPMISTSYSVSRSIPPTLRGPGSLLSAMQLHKKLPDAGRGPIRQKQISSFSFLSSGLTRTQASPAAGFSDRFSECVSPSQAVAFPCTTGYHRSGQTIPDDPGSCRHPPFYRTMAGLKA